MNARDWAQIALVTVGVLFLMLLVIVSIGGCVVGTRDENIDEGVFTVDADCEKNRVKVELDLDRGNTVKEIKVTK